MQKFRVYIRKSSLYYLVQIWDTKDKFLKYRKEQLKLFRNPEEELDCEAYVDPYDVYRVGIKGRAERKLPILGEINFHKGRIGTEIITHETVHAITNYMRRRNKKFASLDKDDHMAFEEEFAYAVGRFNSDLVSILYDKGYYE